LGYSFYININLSKLIIQLNKLLEIILIQECHYTYKVKVLMSLSHSHVVRSLMVAIVALYNITPKYFYVTYILKPMTKS